MKMRDIILAALIILGLWLTFIPDDENAEVTPAPVAAEPAEAPNLEPSILDQPIPEMPAPTE